MSHSSKIEQLKEQRKSVSTELLKLMELKQMELRMQISRIDLDMAKSGYESETDVTQVSKIQGQRLQWRSQSPMDKTKKSMPVDTSILAVAGNDLSPEAITVVQNQYRIKAHIQKGL